MRIVSARPRYVTHTVLSVSFWLAIGVVVAGPVRGADESTDVPEHRVRIAGRDRWFDSIQEAIDAAAEGATIQIEPGQFDERLKIGKSLKLFGAGPEKTILGPTRDGQVRRREAFEKMAEALFNKKPAQENAPAAEEIAAAQALFKEIQEAMSSYSAPIVRIEEARGVELRSLRVTQPDTPKVKSGLITASAVSIQHAQVRIVDSAIVGCMGDGVRAEEGSELEIDDCLVAGAWSTGVAVHNRTAGKLHLVNSDIRNCYHNNIWTGPASSPCVIEGCRISGSAWFGIRFGDQSPRIERNAIFENARSGIYAQGNQGIIKQNLFYKNAMGGACCWSDSKDVFEGNLFIENAEACLFANGASEPAARRKIFVGSPMPVDSQDGIVYSRAAREPENLRPTALDNVQQNLFWNVRPAVLWLPATGTTLAKTEVLPLDEAAGNQTLDPKLSLGLDQQVQLDAGSPLKQWDLAGLLTVSTKSRWPITPEEQAMIPDDGTREWQRWKMRPK